MQKYEENNGMEEIGLVTSTPISTLMVFTLWHFDEYDFI